MKIKQKSIFWGLILILLAALLVLNGIGLFHANAGTIVCCVIMCAIFIHSLLDLSFSGIFFAVAHLVVIFDDKLPLPEDLDKWVIILAGVLVGIGLDIIFRGPKKHFKNKRRNKNYNDGIEVVYDATDDSESSASKSIAGSSEYSNVSKIKISNNFGEQTKYINSDNFRKAEIENSFGNLTVYLDDIKLVDNEAHLNLENGFGKMTLFVPSTFRLDITEDSGFGSVVVQGKQNHNPEAPVLFIKADNGFGSITIVCE